MPAPHVAIPFGINAGFHSGLPRDIVDHYCAWGRDVVVRSPVLSTAQADEVVASLASCARIHLLLLVERNDPALVASLTPWLLAHPGVRIELGNELDLLGLTPNQFAEFVCLSVDGLRQGGYTNEIVSGSIYTVDDHSPQDFDQYLAPMLAKCGSEITIGLHWYGYVSQAWIDRVKALHRPVSITEVGQASIDPATDAAQTIYLQEQGDAYALLGSLLHDVLVYQQASCPDAADHTNLCNYGIQRADRTWKPADNLFRVQ